MLQPSRAAWLPVLALAGGISGCASFSGDGGFKSVERSARERTGMEVRWARSDADVATIEARVDALLAQPLSADAAVQIALLNNKGLQASYAELGIAESDLVQAGRLRNPTLSFGRLKRGAEIEYERALMLPVLSLLTMPLATQVERARFEAAQLRVAGDVLRVADDTRRAYYAAVAAQQSVHYTDQVKAAAEAGAELAGRMTAAGNWSKLQQAREHSFHADAAAQSTRARAAAVVERERLTRLLGLFGPRAEFKLPERLPELPPAPREVADAEATALQNRLDVLLARRELAGLADSLGLTRVTGFIGLLEIGYRHDTSNVEPRRTGWEVELQLPLFDWGGARVARAESQYMQSANRAAELAVNARSEVRAAYAGYRSAYDLARHYRDEIVPLRKRISDEQLLRYNGMLISVFELLADARAQIATVNASIEATRDFWIADSALQMALTGHSVSAAAGTGSAMPRASAATGPANH